MVEAASAQTSSTGQTVTATATVPEQGSGIRLWARGYVKPIVVKIKGKKKKRRYSGSLKGLQKGMRNSTKAGDRFLDALSSGVTKYRKRSDKSARKKKDGSLKDALKNSAAGISTTLRKGSKVPQILAKSVGRRTIRRQLKAMRMFAGGRR